MCEGVDQKATYADAMFVFPSSCHFTKATQILVFLIVEFLDGGYFVTWLGDFPNSSVICVRIFETAISLFEDGLNLNVKILVQHSNNKPINEYFCTGVSRFNCILGAGK